MASDRNRPPGTAGFRWRAIAVPAYGPSLASTLGTGAVAPVLVLQARDLGAGAALAALLVGLVGAGQLANSLPAGALIARVGERWALTAAALVSAAALLGVWRTFSLWWFAALMPVLGAAWTVVLLARQAFIIDAVPDSHRARALSTLGGIQRLGLVIGPLIGAAVIATWGLPAVFAAAAITWLASAAIVQAMPDLGRDTRHHERELGHQPIWDALRQHRRVLLTFGTATSVITGARVVRLTLLPLWCDAIGLSAAETSLIVGLAAGVDLALFYPAGWIMDHHGRAWVATSVVATVAVGFGLLPLARSFETVLAVAVLMALGNGLGAGIVMTMGADLAPRIGRAQFLGGWRLCSDLAGTATPLALTAVLAIAPLWLACLAVAAAGGAGTVWVTTWTRRLDRLRNRARPPPSRQIF